MAGEEEEEGGKKKEGGGGGGGVGISQKKKQTVRRISRCTYVFFPSFSISFVVQNRPKRQPKPSTDEGYWDCSVCTFRNSAEAFKCSMCDVRKGTSTR